MRATAIQIRFLMAAVALVAAVVLSTSMLDLDANAADATGTAAVLPAPQEKDDPKGGEQPAKKADGGKAAADRAATEANNDISDILSKLYRPTEAGLKNAGFTFRHHAFENAAYPFRSTRFHASFVAPKTFEIEVKGLHEAHAMMGTRLAQIMDWVRHVTCGLMVLDEVLVQDRVERVMRTPNLTTVYIKGDKGGKGWQLKFREEDGKYFLHVVVSPNFGTVLLHYDVVNKIQVVTSIDIDDPETALGKWTLRCEDLVVNS